MGGKQSKKKTQGSNRPVGEDKETEGISHKSIPPENGIGENCTEGEDVLMSGGNWKATEAFSRRIKKTLGESKGNVARDVSRLFDTKRDISSSVEGHSCVAVPIKLSESRTIQDAEDSSRRLNQQVTCKDVINTTCNVQDMLSTDRARYSASSVEGNQKITISESASETRITEKVNVKYSRVTQDSEDTPQRVITPPRSELSDEVPNGMSTAWGHYGAWGHSGGTPQNLIKPPRSDEVHGARGHSGGTPQNLIKPPRSDEVPSGISTAWGHYGPWGHNEDTPQSVIKPPKSGEVPSGISTAWGNYWERQMDVRDSITKTSHLELTSKESKVLNGTDKVLDHDLPTLSNRASAESTCQLLFRGTGGPSRPPVQQQDAVKRVSKANIVMEEQKCRPTIPSKNSVISEGGRIKTHVSAPHAENESSALNDGRRGSCPSRKQNTHTVTAQGVREKGIVTLETTKGMAVASQGEITAPSTFGMSEGTLSATVTWAPTGANQGEAKPRKPLQVIPSQTAPRTLIETITPSESKTPPRPQQSRESNSATRDETLARYDSTATATRDSMPVGPLFANSATGSKIPTRSPLSTSAAGRQDKRIAKIPPASLGRSAGTAKEDKRPIVGRQAISSATGSEESTQARPTSLSAGDKTPRSRSSSSTTEVGRSRQGLPTSLSAGDKTPRGRSSSSTTEVLRSRQGLPTSLSAGDKTPKGRSSSSTTEVGRSRQGLPTSLSAGDKTPKGRSSSSTTEVGRSRQGLPTSLSAGNKTPRGRSSSLTTEVGRSRQGLPTSLSAGDKTPRGRSSSSTTEVGRSRQGLPTSLSAGNKTPRGRSSSLTTEVGRSRQGLPTSLSAGDKTPGGRSSSSSVTEVKTSTQGRSKRRSASSATGGKTPMQDRPNTSESGTKIASRGQSACSDTEVPTPGSSTSSNEKYENLTPNQPTRRRGGTQSNSVTEDEPARVRSRGAGSDSDAVNTVVLEERNGRPLRAQVLVHNEPRIAGPDIRVETFVRAESGDKVMIIIFYNSIGTNEAISFLKDALGGLKFVVKSTEGCFSGECLMVFLEEQNFKKAMMILEKKQKECKKMEFTVIKHGDQINDLKQQLTAKLNSTVAKHHEKAEAISLAIEELAPAGKKKGKAKFMDFNTFEKIQTLKQKKEECDHQLEELTKCFDEAISTLEEKTCPMKLTEVSSVINRFQRETHRLDNALPIYAKKSDIVETVRRNQVSVVVGETGSGKSTQMAQYLFDAGLAPGNQQIVCTQPRKVAATSLAQQVAKEMGSKVGQLVGHRVGSSQKANKDTKVVYTTDHALLMECIKDNNLSKYSCIVVDEAHERSIHTDLLLGIIKKALPRRPDLRVIITSATIDPSLFQNYFGGSPVIKVSGRLFPVEVVWKEDLRLNDDYVLQAITKAAEIHRYEQEGDVLVFLTSPAEIDRAKDKLTESLGTEGVVCLPLHGKLQQEEQQKVFQSFPGKRKIVLSTNCAETSVTIPGIKFVVDTGRVKEMKYDEKRGINILEVSVVSQSSAEQRKGRAGRTDSGKCYRLYTEDDFEAMAKGSRPEILRVHLGQAIVKLMELGVKDPVEFDYVEPPPRASITSALETLVKLGAINNGMLTELGRKMSKVPIEPRLAKFLFQGIEDGVGLESLVICSTATVNGSVFFRMGTEEEKKQADVRKVEFCQPEGDFLTLLSVYREWWNCGDIKLRNRWCFEKSLNAKALRMAEETMKELKYSLENEVGMRTAHKKWAWSSMDERKVKETLQRNVLICFSENLCVFSGNNRVGYKTVHAGHYVKLHPSTSLNFVDAQPKFLVYEKNLRTSQDFILNVTPIEERWVQDAVDRREIDLDFEKIDEEILIPIQINCSKALRKITLTPVKQKIEALQHMLERTCNIDIVIVESKPESGVLDVFVPRHYHERVADVVNKYLEEGKTTLRKMTREFLVNPSSRNVRMAVGKGCVPSQILMAGMYRSVVVRFAQDGVKPEDVLALLEQHGTLTECFVHDAALFATYEDPDHAEQAVGEHIFIGQQGREVGLEERRFRVRPNCHWQQKKAQGCGLDARIAWKRREISGRSSVDLSNNPEFLENTRFFGHRPLVVRSTRVSVSNDRHRENSMFIQNLNKDTTKLDIKTAVETTYDVHIEEMDRQINLHYQRRERTTDEMIKHQTEVLRHLIEDHADAEHFTLMVRQPAKETSIIADALVKFTNPVQGMNTVKALNGMSISGLETWNVTLEATCYPKAFLTCPKFICDVLQEEMSSAIIFQNCREQCGNTGKVEIVPARTKGRMLIKVSSQCKEHYITAFVAISNLIKGLKIDCSLSEAHKVLLSDHSKDLLKETEATTGTVIRAVERDSAIYIYGANTNVEFASQLIEAHLQEMVQSGCEVKQIDLRAPDRPRGLLKIMMRRFGTDLAGLYAIPGLKRISVDVKWHVITLYGTPRACEKVVEKVKSAGADLPERTEGGPLLSECPVCLCEVSQPSYRLASCGHEYCMACMQHLVNAKQFPLICSHENCEDVFTLPDLDSLLPEDEIGNFLRAALDWYVKTNQDKARHCPSPDCPMVYRVTTDGKPFKCDGCTNTVCTSCHETEHVGITCEERKLAETEHGQVVLVERWINEDTQHRKRCPKCKTGIEKTEGCNHMLCVACKTHMCWLCLKIFPSDSGVYNHLPYCRNNQS